MELYVSFGADICFTRECRESRGTDIRLELEKWGGAQGVCLSVRYCHVSWIHFQGLLEATGVDGEEWAFEAGVNVDVVVFSIYTPAQMYFSGHSFALLAC